MIAMVQVEQLGNCGNCGNCGDCGGEGIMLLQYYGTSRKFKLGRPMVGTEGSHKSCLHGKRVFTM